MWAVCDRLAGEVFRSGTVVVECVPQSQAALADVAEVVKERVAVGGRRSSGGKGEGVNCCFELADVRAVNTGTRLAAQNQPRAVLRAVEEAPGGEVE